MGLWQIRDELFSRRSARRLLASTARRTAPAVYFGGHGRWKSTSDGKSFMTRLSWLVLSRTVLKTRVRMVRMNEPLSNSNTFLDWFILSRLVHCLNWFIDCFNWSHSLSRIMHTCLSSLSKYNISRVCLNTTYAWFVRTVSHCICCSYVLFHNSYKSQLFRDYESDAPIFQCLVGLIQKWEHTPVEVLFNDFAFLNNFVDWKGWNHSYFDKGYKFTLKVGFLSEIYIH